MGTGVLVGSGVRVRVGVRVAVGVRVGVGVLVTVDVNEGVAEGRCVGASPVTVNLPDIFQ